MRTCPACGYDNLLRAKRCLKCGSDVPLLSKERRLEEGGYLGKTFRYQLNSKIDKGPYSEFWVANDLKFRRKNIALKIVEPETIEKKGAIDALKKAALLVIPHVHPNLERIQAFENDESFAFFVVEYIEGPTFSTLLKKRKTLMEEEILWAAREIAAGLLYLHKHNLCHGNLNLANLMLSQDPPQDKLPTIATARSHPHQCVRICDQVIGLVVRDIKEGRKRRPPSRWSVCEDARALVGVLLSFYSGKPPDVFVEEPVKTDSFPDSINKIVSLCLEATPESRNLMDVLIAAIEGKKYPDRKGIAT
ncbi:protein kinase [Candidatus Sumerlaeota bacterium]|nr:protein kinase [Candidatus Sumerlaeota bacterium]